MTDHMGRSLKTSRSMAAARARARALQSEARDVLAREAATSPTACSAGHELERPGAPCGLCSFLDQMKLARRWAG